MNLKQKAINGVKWTTISSMFVAILHLIQLMVLSRFLSPHDFGLYAILTLIIGFSNVFVDFGLSNSIIYEKDVTQKQLSTLYWLNILMSIFVYVIIFIMAVYISDFYNEPELYKLILITNIILIIQSFGQQFRVLFQKELQFNTIAKIDVFASTISVICAILFAIYNFEVYALVYSLIIMAIIKSGLLIFFGREHHIVKFYFSFQEIKKFLKFGLYVVGNGMVSTIATQIDTILIGKLLGTEMLGFYNVAKELILKPSQLINPIITKVAFPVISKVNNDISEVKRLYLKLLNYISSVNFPIYIATIILAPEIITFFLGVKWLEITYLFQILAAWAFLRSRANPIGTLVMALGKPQYEMYWNIFMLVYMPIMVYIASFWGIIGIAYGNLLSFIILFVPGWYFLTFKLSGIGLKEDFMSTFSPMIISIFTGLIVSLFVNIGIENLIYKIFITFFIGLFLLFFFYKKYNSNFYFLLKKLLNTKEKR